MSTAKKNTREEIKNYFGYSEEVMAAWWDTVASDADRDFFENLDLND